MNPQLPTELAYLQPFLDQLRSLPAEEWNEDVDSSLLESSLKQRMKTGTPDSILNNDRKTLGEWLNSFDSQEHPGHWIAGFLLHVRADDILREADSVDTPDVAITIAPPKGWKTSSDRSKLSKRGAAAFINIIDEFTAELLQSQFETQVQLQSFRAGQLSKSQVTFGASNGWKYVYEQTKPTKLSQIDYLLTVPGGVVHIRIQSDAIGFDHNKFESALPSLELKRKSAG